VSHPRNDLDVTNTIQTTDAHAVRDAVIHLFSRLYPSADTGPLDRAFADSVAMYRGEHSDYHGCDTGYHDLQHTLEITLAMARLMDGYERGHPGAVALGPRLFQLGVIAALFHDIGYLRKRDADTAPTGAHYTLTHVSRGALFLSTYLSQIGMPEFCESGAEMLHFTGFEKPVGEVAVADPMLRLLGCLLGSADIIAQMADRCYLEKCRDRLYPEFVAGGIAVKRSAAGVEILYSSGEDLVHKTPAFFHRAIDRLDYELGGAYRYAETHFGGPNLYVEAAARQVNFAARFADEEAPLRREPPTETAPRAAHAEGVEAESSTAHPAKSHA
jgi:hypothetical protein